MIDNITIPSAVTTIQLSSVGTNSQEAWAEHPHHTNDDDLGGKNLTARKQQ